MFFHHNFILRLLQSFVWAINVFLYEQQKYPCLFNQKEKNAKDVATAMNVLQYHIIPGKAFTYLELHDIAISSNYMSSTALNGKKLYITEAGTKINGYSTINYPDIGVLETQTIHGISSLLAPPGLVVTNSFLLHLIKQVLISFFPFSSLVFFTTYMVQYTITCLLSLLSCFLIL